VSLVLVSSWFMSKSMTVDTGVTMKS